MQGRKTPIDIKAKIIEAKINTNAQWSVIAEELQKGRGVRLLELIKR